MTSSMLPHNAGCQNFMKLVERTSNAFELGEDTAVEDARRILLDVRKQYDSVHFEAEQKDAALKSRKEILRATDASHSTQGDETRRLADSAIQLQQQLTETEERIHETKTNRKVYAHMLARIQREQAILKEKMLKMEAHLNRKEHEVLQQEKAGTRKVQVRIQRQQALAGLERDALQEKDMCLGAREVMDGELERRKESNKSRAAFESWRHDIALEAANDAFNASAGRLRKLYAIEKLQGNALQKTTFEQVERSQTTEDGFQKVREVTGLADVMDIVHKFLNRDVEHEQLKSSVKESELRLESLRQSFDSLRRETEGITFQSGATTARSGELYKEVEQNEQMLADAMKDHETCRQRLQKTTLQFEHLKRWCARVGKLLHTYQEPVKVENPADLKLFFDSFDEALRFFLTDVQKQISEGKMQRKIMAQVQTREFNDQLRWLGNDQNQKNNCRVPAVADAGPFNRQGQQDEDLAEALASERERCKEEAGIKMREAQMEQQKRRTKEGSKSGQDSAR